MFSLSLSHTHTDTHTHAIQQYHYSEAPSSKLQHAPLASFQTLPLFELLFFQKQSVEKVWKPGDAYPTCDPTARRTGVQALRLSVNDVQQLGFVAHLCVYWKESWDQSCRGEGKEKEESSVLASNSSAVRGILMSFLLEEALSAADCSKIRGVRFLFSHSNGTFKGFLRC